MDEDISLTLKIIILGSSEVGKTSILDRYFQNIFRSNPLSTIGIDFQTKFFKFDSRKIKVNYTDTAGQEKFHAISINYLKAANGVILVFDVTKQQTFDALEDWLKDLKENNKLEIQKVLIGNKVDLEEYREVKKEDAENFAKSIGCNYFEGSAKTGQNINEALDEIARITYLAMKDVKKEEEDKDKDVVIIDKSKKGNTKKKKFC